MLKVIEKRDEREAGEELLLLDERARGGTADADHHLAARVGPRHAHDPVPVVLALADVDDGLRLPGSLRRLQPNEGSAPS
jgi:hypothetical protein